MDTYVNQYGKTMQAKHINFEAWSRTLIGFIRHSGLEQQLKDWSGGWPCPIGSDPKDEQIASLRAKLFPYADATEISGTSWDGKYLIGDTASIKFFHEMKNRGEQIDVYKRAYDQSLAAKDAEIANLTAALTGKFCVCFMDGINEHRTHVLPSFPRSCDCDFDVLEQAQAIWAAGEIEGFQAGDHIWCEFTFHPAQTGEYGQVEVASYWEFTRVDADLSRAINAAALKEQADA